MVVRRTSNKGVQVNAHLPMIYVTEKVVWQYKHLVWNLSESGAPTEEELNSFGEEGWELAGVFQEKDTIHFYFKRPKE